MIEVRGADQLAALARALKEAGEKGLQRELARGIAKAVRPFKAAVANSASDTLPSSGGLAARAAAGSVPRVRRNANGVRMVATGKQGLKGLRALNAGTVRHPVYGRDAWVSQSVAPGFWDRAVEEVAPEVRKGIEEAMDAVAKKIGGAA